MANHENKRPMIYLPMFFDSEDNIEYEATQFLKRNLDSLDSPKTQQALRNAVLALLELSEPSLNRANVVRMLTDEQFRFGILNRLKAETPTIWSKEWNKFTKINVHPLLSNNQERFVRRTSIIRYWDTEWRNLSINFKTHLRRLAPSVK